jgi:hypothetical protein
MNMFDAQVSTSKFFLITWNICSIADLLVRWLVNFGRACVTRSEKNPPRVWLGSGYIYINAHPTFKFWLNLLVKTIKVGAYRDNHLKIVCDLDRCGLRTARSFLTETQVKLRLGTLWGSCRNVRSSQQQSSRFIGFGRGSMTHWHVRSINKRVRDRRVTYPFVTNWRGNSWGIRFSVPELTLCLAALQKVLSNFDHLALVKAVSFSSAEKNDIWWKKFGKHVFVQWLNGEHLQIILSSVVCSCFFGEMIEGTESVNCTDVTYCAWWQGGHCYDLCSDPSKIWIIGNVKNVG